MFAPAYKTRGKTHSVNLKYYERIGASIVMLWHKRKKEKDFTPEQD